MIVKDMDGFNSLPPNPRRADQMDITIEGYKSIYSPQKLEIRPLTILAGANSSGKSSIFQPLLLMKQTLEAVIDPGPFLLSGSYLQFSQNAQIFSDLGKFGKAKNLKIRIEWRDDLYFQLEYGRNKQKELEVRKTTICSGKMLLDLKPGMSHEEIIKRMPEVKQYGGSLVEGHLGIFKTKPARCFLALGISTKDDPQSFFEPIKLDLTLIEMLRNMLHIPGFRGNPERVFPLTAVGEKFPGSFENYAPSILQAWGKSDPVDPRLNNVCRDLERLGLASAVRAKRLDDSTVEVSVSRSLKSPHEFVGLADVGFGVSQALPILVALQTAKKGHIVHLEQPELHLHPRAQQAMGDILAEAAQRGVVVVVETHSEALLLRLQTLVAEGKVSPKIVKLHWFTKDPEGQTHVSIADLDQNGAFGRWPADFAELGLEAEDRYLRAVENQD